MPSLIRNVLALIGIAALLAVGIGYAQFQRVMGRLDPGAAEVFSAAGSRYLDTLDPGVTMVRT